MFSVYNLAVLTVRLTVLSHHLGAILSAVNMTVSTTNIIFLRRFDYRLMQEFFFFWSYSQKPMYWVGLENFPTFRSIQVYTQNKICHFLIEWWIREYVYVLELILYCLRVDCGSYILLMEQKPLNWKKKKKNFS